MLVGHTWPTLGRHLAYGAGMKNDHLCILGLASGLACLLAGCGTTEVVSRMPNPAKTTDRIHASQGWEMGPVKENHQYEMTIDGWTPQAVLVKMRLLDTGRCAEPESYTFQLRDDKGDKAPLHPKGEKKTAQKMGREGMKLTETTAEGEFLVNVGPDTRFVVVEQRPQWGYDCPSLDYRWNLD
jgi:hypothetical protein